MKICYSLFCLLIFIINLNAQGFVLKGTIPAGDINRLVIHYTAANGTGVKDSAAVINGHFEFMGNITEPTMAYLDGPVKSKSMNDPNATSFFLDPVVMSIELQRDHFKDAVVSGSATQDEYNTLLKSEEQVNRDMAPFVKSYDSVNEQLMQAIKEKKPVAFQDSLKSKADDIRGQFSRYNEAAKQIDYAYFRSHPKSFVTAFMLQFYVNDLGLDSMRVIYARLGQTIQHSAFGKHLASEIKKLAAGSPGSRAADFSAKDMRGKNFTFSGLKGKYVLIDFWASWCIPCRKNVPIVKAWYRQYKDKGLAIVAVADDDNDIQAWTKAIRADSTGAWIHVLRGFDMQKMMQGINNPNDISEKYGIHSLPSKILVNPNGVIIGRYTEPGDEENETISKKLREIFGN